MTDTADSTPIEKLKMHSPDLTQRNIAWIAEKFPGCVTEGKVDFDLLRQELSDSIVEGPQERYHLDWPGKRQALITANAPIAKTLRPVRAESVDFDTTRNLFIEGDNLEALKLLQETYLGKVKMIYIDPPYNTGNDFVYEDDFAESTAEFLEKSNQVDEAGNRLVANTQSNGRFHSDWLSMMYSRVRLAKSFLSDDGLFFVSIDQNEVHNLRKLCDEIFGEPNFATCVSRPTGTPTGGGNNKFVNELDYILVYSVNSSVKISGLEMLENDEKIYNQQDERGRYLTRPLRRTGGEDRREDRPSMYYPLTAPDGSIIFPIAPAGYESRWRCGYDKYIELARTGFIEWKQSTRDGKDLWQVFQKFYLEGRSKQPSNLWANLEGNKKATREISDLFEGKKVFDHPKPTDVIKRILSISGLETGDVVMDFFAGSGTTMHGSFRWEAETGVCLKKITIQIPEAVARDHVGYSEGYFSIAEISKERIRRAGRKILEGECHPDWNRDVGFRVLKIDSSNMADVYYTPDATTQADLLTRVDNIKEGRSAEDLLFQVLLDWGVDLTLPITRETVQGKTVFSVAGTALIACFDTGVDAALVKELAARHPLRVVFRDTGFADDATKINVKQIFRSLSPDTEMKAI
ncbi:MAG: site-specific DNA-methyltransferase [Paracoccaceae bacterium]|nr:site-specific DNA-methyltransferase [Paracoccaceae bacterium]